MYITAYIFLVAIIILAIIRLWQAVKAWDAHQAVHRIKTCTDLKGFTVGIGTNVEIGYTTYKASSGVLEAYKAGLAFRVAETMYDASQGLLVTLRDDKLPAFVQQTILEELRNDC